MDDTIFLNCKKWKLFNRKKKNFYRQIKFELRIFLPDEEDKNREKQKLSHTIIQYNDNTNESFQI